MKKVTIKTSGQQIRTKTGEIITVDRVKNAPGEKITYDDVLLIEDGENITIGKPVIENAKVHGEVVEHFRDKKIRIFKMKRRKKYRRVRGHRSDLSKVKITEIVHS